VKGENSASPGRVKSIARNRKKRVGKEKKKDRPAPNQQKAGKTPVKVSGKKKSDVRRLGQLESRENLKTRRSGSNSAKGGPCGGRVAWASALLAISGSSGKETFDKKRRAGITAEGVKGTESLLPGVSQNRGVAMVLQQKHSAVNSKSGGTKVRKR